MVETVKKPSSNRSAKERRNTLFRVLDGVLSTAHRKFHAGGNSNWAKISWPNVPVLVVLFCVYASPIRFMKSRNFSYVLRYSIPFSVSFREVSS